MAWNQPPVSRHGTQLSGFRHVSFPQLLNVSFEVSGTPYFPWVPPLDENTGVLVQDKKRRKKTQLYKPKRMGAQLQAVPSGVTRVETPQRAPSGRAEVRVPSRAGRGGPGAPWGGGDPYPPVPCRPKRPSSGHASYPLALLTAGGARAAPPNLTPSNPEGVGVGLWGLPSTWLGQGQGAGPGTLLGRCADVIFYNKGNREPGEEGSRKVSQCEVCSLLPRASPAPRAIAQTPCGLTG